MLFVYFLASPTAHDQLQVVPPLLLLLCLQPHSPFVYFSSIPLLLLSLIIKSNKLFSIDLLASQLQQHPRNVA